MKEIEVQREFCALVARLIDQALVLGFTPRLGDAFRDPTVPYGHPHSTHRHRLALDLLLDKQGKWLEDTESYRELGEWWEKVHPLARWGGRWGDGNHFSFEWNGVK